MKKVLLSVGLLVTLFGCNPFKEKVSVVNGVDGATGPQGIPGEQGNVGPKGDKGDAGTSCTTSNYMSEGEDPYVLGSLITCTDGSFSYILNGLQGPRGPQGPTGGIGAQGETGEQGAQGEPGVSCTVSRDYNNEDDNKDEDKNNYVVVTCGDYSEKIYDGETGPRGYSGKQGAQGETGTQGVAGEQGQQGIQGEQGVAGTDGQSCYQSGTTTQNITFNDYTILPVAGVPGVAAYCSKNGQSNKNPNQYNSCDNGWTYHAAVAAIPAIPGEYTVRTITVTLPTFSCGAQ